MTQESLLAPRSWAVLSDDERYRYALGREWGDGPRVTWVMLNPSTADADTDDPTIRKCVGFSKRWGYGGLAVVNLFALRATDPKALRSADDPVGPDNAEHALAAVMGSDLVVAAWGASKRPDSPVPALLIGREALCLGVTKSGEPRHPLYVPYTTEPSRLLAEEGTPRFDPMSDPAYDPDHVTPGGSP